ncbi:MAG: ribosome biogenesis GTPase YlqF [Agarilytica sp.]
MTIQWYPGHMHKAQKEIKESLSKVDIVIEVLDARIPFSSENPLIAKLRGDKPCVKVLSKSDLADPMIVKQWQEAFEKERGVKTLPITKDDPNHIKNIPGLCKKMLPNKARGVKTRAMIVGIPNVGKSTLINVLAGRMIAKTGNEPAVTKTQQHIQLEEDFLLLDTPGILWPKQEYEHSSYRLAATGAIKDTAMEYEDVAFFAYEYLKQAYPELLKERFQLESLPSTEIEFFELAGRQRGCLGRGGRVDLTKISEQFIHELRAGMLGLICMETPSMVSAEVKAAEIKAEEKRLAKEKALEQKKKGKRK